MITIVLLTPDEAVNRAKTLGSNRITRDRNLVAYIEAHYKVQGWRMKPDGIVRNSRAIVDAGRLLTDGQRQALETMATRYFGSVPEDAR